MIYFRACIRCKGDVLMDRDAFGGYFKCLQCGFSRDIPAREERNGPKAAATGVPAAQPATDIPAALKQAS
ncbi:MAG: hypothetical protein HY682_08620 [Chloroflexi bacterium]|nr:hypothetical protein [Chloroflexota bacterium]